MAYIVKYILQHERGREVFYTRGGAKTAFDQVKGWAIVVRRELDDNYNVVPDPHALVHYKDR